MSITMQRAKQINFELIPNRERRISLESVTDHKIKAHETSIIIDGADSDTANSIEMPPNYEAAGIIYHVYIEKKLDSTSGAEGSIEVKDSFESQIISDLGHDAERNAMLFNDGFGWYVIAQPAASN